MNDVLILVLPILAAFSVLFFCVLYIAAISLRQIVKQVITMNERLLLVVVNREGGDKLVGALLQQSKPTSGTTPGKTYVGTTTAPKSGVRVVAGRSK